MIVIWTFLLVTFSKFSCNDDDDDDTCGADTSTSALPDSSSFACSILDDNKGDEDDDGRPWLAILELWVLTCGCGVCIRDVVVVASVFVVSVFVVSSSCTTCVHPALASVPGDICDDGDDGNDNNAYKDNMTGASGVIACDPSFALAPLKICG